MSLPVQYQFSLRPFNTFGIEAKAHAYLRVTSNDQLRAVKEDAALNALPRLVLGGGSNLLLTRDFPGLVLHMATTGIDIVGEDANATHVKAAAGENWHQFVQWTLGAGLGGLENLSLIPGSVGASPIQNIGAYGVELKDTFHALTAFNTDTGETFVLDKAACHFGYRDSVFKHAFRDQAVILDVTFALPKQWQPNVQYADVAQELAACGIAAPTPRQISDAVIAIRTRKLPDPAQIGNAGSFFKNPIVTAEQRDALLARYPKLVSYAQADGTFKLAAGWLIDQSGWKGRSIGAAGVYEKQALVLVNRGGASGRDIAELAAAIQADVLAKFGVMLEPEPVFI
ncbi:UDP-N-acetylmuramate dehydrogenase [Noviherbaspirillum autotrophicum]|uniref:UDP-N-acetylenolpyruvoylglucosamine reductase n=1 Tax=Noviherbaspirillum autotrophicum TaxID=709839 RepID=A0A0C2BHD7_9BURK|nr:UDP-N-acetylmuramate dehydrogenase [Noviherbaspirillum autotrophicum]KIF80655.1 UDP-N-acetylenolpyruvoylglucosamine reductase [Noviherbaspirillum autotrophicum]